MNELTLNYTGRLVIESCCICDIAFAIPEGLQKKAKADHSINFYCPQGHSQHYIGKTETQRLRDEIARQKQFKEWAQAREKATADQLRASEYRRRAAKANLTKLKKRIANGICPCCHRNFANVKAHMSTQHPDFTLPAVD
jgi:hypothetical protein